MNTLPPALLALVAAWGANVADFTAAFEDQIANKGYAPAEFVAKVLAVLQELGVIVNDPNAMKDAMIHALLSGYWADHGGVA